MPEADSLPDRLIALKVFTKATSRLITRAVAEDPDADEDAYGIVQIGLGEVLDRLEALWTLTDHYGLR